MNKNLEMATVKLIDDLLKPLVNRNVIPPCDHKYVIEQLTHLAEHGEYRPIVVPKLIEMEEAATMLGIGLSLFKKCEKENRFPFKRKMIGTSVRYRNTDIIDYIQSDDK